MQSLATAASLANAPSGADTSARSARFAARDVADYAPSPEPADADDDGDGDFDPDQEDAGAEGPPPPPRAPSARRTSAAGSTSGVKASVPATGRRKSKYDIEALDQVGKAEPEDEDAPQSKRVRGAGPASPEKRRAQNRVAQQNFRQRRENYVKELERRLEGEAAEHAQLRAQLQWLHKRAGPTVVAMLESAPSTGSSHSASDDERNGPMSANGSSHEVVSGPTSATHAPAYYPPVPRAPSPSSWSRQHYQPQPHYSPPTEYDTSFQRAPSLPPIQQPDWSNYATQVQMQPIALGGHDMSNLRGSPWPYAPPQQSAPGGPYFQPAPVSTAHWGGGGSTTEHGRCDGSPRLIV